MQALFLRILLLALGLCNISEEQASVGSSVAWNLQLEYDVMGRESLCRLLGGVESQTRYDGSGRVTDQVTKGAGYEVNHRSYEWDLSGKLRRLTAGTYTAEFDYDVVGTLAAARYDEVDILYKLPDRIGNIYPDRFGKEATYERGGRRKEDKEWTYHFDGEGFLTQRVSKTESIERYDWIRRKLLTEPLTWTYEWDGAGQLVRVKNNDKVNLRFEYDALGRRVAKINEYGRAEGHKITRFLWNGNVPLHEWSYPLSDRPETIDDGDGRRGYASPEPQTELTTWIFDEGTFVPSAKLVGERRYSIISDYLGTPIEAYDEEGQRVWARELDIYGRTRSEEGAVGFIPFLYQGQYLDGETGLAYNRFRYYSPETGAYISQDPIRLEAGLTNLYAYVHDVNAWVDPWGLTGIDRFPSWMPTKQGYERHHIIPYEYRSHEIFQLSGMNINSSTNMIYLPVTESVHPSKAVHSNFKLNGKPHAEYNALMGRKLDKLLELSKAEGWSIERIRKELLSLEYDTRGKLNNARGKNH